MSNAANAGLVKRRLQQIRGDEDVPGIPGAYAVDGVSRVIPGDDEAPWSKAMPFPSAPALWDGRTFIEAATYKFLDLLDVGDVRTVTTYFAVTGGASGASQLSIVGGVPLNGAPNRILNMKDFYPIGVVNATPTAVTLDAPFSCPAMSRTVMDTELRTTIVPTAETIRFVLQWDVSAYQRFTLALLDLGYADDDGLSVLVHYATAN